MSKSFKLRQDFYHLCDAVAVQILFLQHKVKKKHQQKTKAKKRKENSISHWKP